MPNRRAACLVVLFLAGCSFNSSRPVEGWPELTVVEHNVSQDEMRHRCVQYMPAGMTPLACAQFNFAASRCDIWYGRLWLLRAIVVAHEREHCRGYQHAGEHHLEQVLRDYRAAAAGGS